MKSKKNNVEKTNKLTDVKSFLNNKFSFIFKTDKEPLKTTKNSEFKKVDIKKLVKKSKKRSFKNTSKQIYVGLAVMIFSFTFLFGSFFKFKTDTVPKASVKGVYTKSVVYAPINSEFIDNIESKTNKNTYTYKTNLSNGQINLFYSQLAKLNNWEKKSEYSYSCSKGTFSYSITAENNESNLVTYTVCD